MRFIRTLALVGLTVATLSACADLAVTNLNNPDRERAISTPGDVASLILGAFQSWHVGTFQRAPNIAFSAVANEHAASWGNFGMNDMRRQPREIYNNDPSYSYEYVASWPWENMFAALAGIRDVHRFLMKQIHRLSARLVWVKAGQIPESQQERVAPLTARFVFVNKAAHRRKTLPQLR